LRKALVVAAVAFLALAPLARADGDPASDYLLTQTTFVPPDLGISDADAARLAAIVQSAHAGGYTIRVALIGSRYDLGSIGTVFGQPKHYARFLGQELTLVYHGRLLVVMPTGYGIARAGTLIPSEQAALDRLPAPGRSGDQLVAAAIEGVRQLAAASGVVVAVPPPPATGGSSTAAWIWVVVGLAIALVVALAAWALVRRRR
jgi:LPXTG-motif cell wall-anchored protein